MSIKTFIVLNNGESSQAWEHLFCSRDEAIEYVNIKSSHWGNNGKYNVDLDKEHHYVTSYLDRRDVKDGLTTTLSVHFNILPTLNS